MVAPAWEKMGSLRALLSGMARFERPSGQGPLAGREGARRIERPGRNPAVLCIHGYGGVPGEVELCCDVASELGHRTVAPVLAGHGLTPRALSPCRFEDWLSGVRVEFDQLRKDGPVILVGLSLGAVLATALTLEAPGDVKGLALLANAFWLRDPFPGAALDLYGKLGLPDFGLPKDRSDIGDPRGLAAHVSYDMQPVHAAISVRRAGARLQEELFRIHCPTLILHGARDRVCPVDNAWKAAALMTEIQPRVVIFPRSHHILTRDAERDAVRQELRDFLQHLGGP